MTLSNSVHLERIREQLADGSLPAALVDLDAFDRNVMRVAEVSKKANKSVRIATKSIRVVDLIRRALQVGAPYFRGLMTFSLNETKFLSSCGFDDFLVAYPTTDPGELECLHALYESERNVAVVADCEHHLHLLQKAWPGTGQQRLSVILEQDVSLRPFGLVHIGAQRSPLRSSKTLLELAHKIDRFSHLRFGGIMAYESQIAGLPNQTPGQWFKNNVIQAIQSVSRRDTRNKRCKTAKELEKYPSLTQQSGSAFIFNGGGTGSLSSSIKEPALTEVTVGSGLLQSMLFDSYAGNVNEPALFFGLRVDRHPERYLATTKSGGFIASGPPAVDRSPTAISPRGLKPLQGEGFGEVQTPLKTSSTLAMGDCVLCRPAKAGEPAERFSHYLAYREGQPAEWIPTYRGQGQCFF